MCILRYVYFGTEGWNTGPITGCYSKGAGMAARAVRIASIQEESTPLAQWSVNYIPDSDFYGCDDAMYVALRLLRILGNQTKTLNELKRLGFK